jgi:hypothetical protein
MTDYYRNRLNMLNATLAHFDEHPDVWQSEAPIAAQVPLVREGRDAMLAAESAKRSSDTQAITEQKQQAREDLTETLTAFSKRLRAYALVADLPELRRVARSKTAWNRLPDADLVREANILADKTAPHLDNLGSGYKITETTLQEVRQQADAYGTFSERRANVQADRSTANEDVAEAYRTLDRPLEILDLLVPTLLQDAAFIAEYENVRRILGE